MATITYPQALDLDPLARSVRRWFKERGFETKRECLADQYVVKARKSSVWRALLAADRAINVSMSVTGDRTEVIVSQGDWTTNLVSNAAWFALTGGTNLLISGWSVVIQKQLEAHIRQ